MGYKGAYKFNVSYFDQLVPSPKPNIEIRL
jgi:hypothetical protein